MTNDANDKNRTTNELQWTLKSELGFDILGTTDQPLIKPTACVALVHGFKGYKDYGFIPVLGKALAASGIITHRFNVSCSGMTNETETFKRPDLFAQDTWNRQISDMTKVLDAIDDGTLLGQDLPRFLAGHSRGGATAIMTAGRSPQPVLNGVITINSVAACCTMAADARSKLLEDGFMISPSGRTGQELTINATWLKEQLDAPDMHDVLAIASTIECPLLILHGDADDAVPFSAAEDLSRASNCPVSIIKNADHVLNTPNPAPQMDQNSAQLDEVIKQIQSFVIANHHKTPI
ncbi:MAG: alpha/beta hydrolase [Phycisphaerales bacterium]